MCTEEVALSGKRTEIVTESQEVCKKSWSFFCANFPEGPASKVRRDYYVSDVEGYCTIVVYFRNVFGV